MRFASLQDLFVNELNQLYDTEQQLLKSLPLMAKAAESEELKMAFKDHAQETRLQAERLERIFESFGTKPKTVMTPGIRGLIAESAEIMAREKKSAGRDAALIAAGQKVEHYEIAGYGCARTYAQQLGHSEAARLLNDTIREEAEADRLLTRIASHVNREARTASLETSFRTQGEPDGGAGWGSWLLGLGIGLGAAMLLAPRTGAEMRGALRGGAGRGRDYLRRRGSELRESAEGLIERGRDAVSRQRGGMETSSMPTGTNADITGTPNL